MGNEPRDRWIGVGRWGLGLSVVAFSIWLLARDLDWSAGRALGAVDYRWVAAWIAAIVGTFFTRTCHWQALLWHTRVPARPAMTALLVGQMVNLALPMRSDDVARAAWIAPGTTDWLS
ncbi:MAG: lysylphosphatidylglycerol synthase domain-containing protein [Candidatus Bathyarchaeia archaeon]